MQNLTINLLKAELKDYPTLQNLARFYVYDMSRYCGFLPGWSCPETGLYVCYDLKKFFTQEHHHPFIIRVNNELAGFVFVNNKATMPDIDWCISEFFVMAKFQKHGVGKEIAKQVWQQFPGRWELCVIPQNERGLMFWRKTIREFTDNQFSENTKAVSWDKINPRVVFHFDVKET